ncbi:Pyrroline-5-carboxylate reductase [bioreactor metagenome]|uniref:Pyrroline-5-carboxylate reductase n=1 Tax=bioreactor metagenome TaxID=1076179 RepID=A0A645CFE9_9ZZZZ
MPNTPLLIGQGVCAVAHDQTIPENEYDLIFTIFSSIGLVCFVPEDKMNEVTAISGSGPAYVYYFIDSMARFGQNNGIDYETSLKLASATFLGAAKMIEQTKSSPAELIQKVTSPGGTTIEAMKHFYEKDIAGIIDEAMTKCAKRGYELSV